MMQKALAVRPPLSNRRRVQLDTLPRCRRELAKLYQEARHGDLDPQTATRLAFLITSIARLIEGAELEARIARLEEGMTGKAR